MSRKVCRANTRANTEVGLIYPQGPTGLGIQGKRIHRHRCYVCVAPCTCMCSQAGETHSTFGTDAMLDTLTSLAEEHYQIASVGGDS